MIEIRREVEFWTRILKDHAEFQIKSLAPTETENIRKAKYFKELFEKLNEEVKTNQNDETLISTNKTAVSQFVKFKKVMMKKIMSCEVDMTMAPSFLNHMINEAMEYYRVLMMAEETLPFNEVLENIRLHKIWLPDASGHAKFIASQLDGIEAFPIKEANEFIDKFDMLTKKAYELYTMFERTGLTNGGLHQFNYEVESTLNDFVVFLEKLEVLRNECKIFASGTFNALIPNHMIREEKYYISRIKALRKANRKNK